MKLRFANLYDAKSISEIYAPFIQTTITFEYIAPDETEFKHRIQTITENYPWSVLEDSHKILGYAYLSPFNVRHAYQHSADLSIYLSDHVKGKGFGRIMCEALFEIAKVQNIYRIVSLITKENEASKAFHQKLGFNCQGNLTNVGYKHDKWLDVSFYIKNIQGINKPESFIPIPQLKEKAQIILDQFNQIII